MHLEWQWALRFQVFSNNIILSNLLNKASSETGDPLWQLPLWQNYNNQILSNHVTIKILEIVVLEELLSQTIFRKIYQEKDSLDSY